MAPNGKEEEAAAVSSGGWRTLVTAALTGALAAFGTVSAAYLAGYFDVTKTATQNSGTIDLEKLKFADNLVERALASNNPANSLLFYSDAGLLANLNVESIRKYAERENSLNPSSKDQSILPQVGNFKKNSLWLSKDFFAKFSPEAHADLITPIETTGNYILHGFGISENVNRLSYFIGIIAWETGMFTKLNEENGDFSAVRLTQVFPTLFNQENVTQYANNPQKALSRAYANRMGNGPEDSGDGFKFRGRGYIQITGKSNYEKFSNLTGIDLVTDPSIASNPDAALLVAAAFWQSSRVNDLADNDQAEALFRKFYGEANPPPGLKASVNKAKDILQNSARQ